MDTYFDFASFVNEPEGFQIPSYELSDAPSSDIPVDAERAGSGLSCSMCIVC